MCIRDRVVALAGPDPDIRNGLENIAPLDEGLPQRKIIALLLVVERVVRKVLPSDVGRSERIVLAEPVVNQAHLAISLRFVTQAVLRERARRLEGFHLPAFTV